MTRVLQGVLLCVLHRVAQRPRRQGFRRITLYAAGGPVGTLLSKGHEQASTRISRGRVVGSPLKRIMLVWVMRLMVRLQQMLLLNVARPPGRHHSVPRLYVFVAVSSYLSPDPWTIRSVKARNIPSTLTSSS
jgi:hypothetical protein